MFTFDKAIAGLVVPVIAFMITAALSAESDATGAALSVLTDIDTWVVAILTAGSVYLKGNADTIYTADPAQVQRFLDDERGGVRLRAGLLTLVALLTATACSTAFTSTGKTPAQQFYGFANQYALVKQEAAAFVRSGPLCSEQDIVTCVPDSVVIAIDEVTDEFDPAIAAAITLFESRTATPQTQQATIALARQAVIALAATLAEREAS
jgi:ABC-type transport system involved in multi-copper enzyme maturation permease subunit